MYLRCLEYIRMNIENYLLIFEFFKTSIYIISVQTNKTNMNKPEIINKYKETCNNLVDAINELLFDNCRDPYWVNDVVGDICDFGDTDFLTPEEMSLILENNMTYEQYAEWRDANLNNQYINLRSWIKGCRHYMLTNNN